MPTPAWKKRLPKARSFNQRMVADILNDDKNLTLGPVGTSAKAVHPIGSPILGKPPRRERYPSNPDLRDTVRDENPDTRERRARKPR